jgi:hypothetical protein
VFGAEGMKHFLQVIYLSEEPRFSVTTERKACKKNLSLYMEEIVFVINQEPSGRRDWTCKKKGN